MANTLPDAPKVLTPRQWTSLATTQATLQHQLRIVPFLLWAYGLFSAATFSIFFLQGFHAWGFNLDLKILLWLGGATIGELGGLLLLTFRFVFKR